MHMAKQKKETRKNSTYCVIPNLSRYGKGKTMDSVKRSVFARGRDTDG